MTLMAQEIGQTFKEMDLTKTQADWERAVAQAGTVEEMAPIARKEKQNGNEERAPGLHTEKSTSGAPSWECSIRWTTRRTDGSATCPGSTW